MPGEGINLEILCTVMEGQIGALEVPGPGLCPDAAVADRPYRGSPEAASAERRAGAKVRSRLARSGLIARVWRGLYLVPPTLPVAGRWSPYGCTWRNPWPVTMEVAGERVRIPLRRGKGGAI